MSAPIDPRIDEIFQILFVLAQLAEVTRLAKEKFVRPTDGLSTAHNLAIGTLMVAEAEARPIIEANGATLSLGHPNSVFAATQAFAPEARGADPDELIKQVIADALAAADAAKAGA